MDHQRCTYGRQAITSSLIDAHKIAPKELPEYIKCIDTDDKIAIAQVMLIQKGQGKGEEQWQIQGGLLGAAALPIA